MKKTQPWPTLAARLALVLVVSLAGCAARQYSSEPIDIRVVDAETKEPIEGALVVARWVAKVDTVIHAPRESGSVEVLETTTGPDGRFHFPAWGPVRYDGRGTLLDQDPLIHVFKRGYWARHIDNSQYGAPASKDRGSRGTGAVRASLWSGETIEMKPFKTGVREFASTVYWQFVSVQLDHVFFGETSTPCDWRKLPRTIAYLERERKAYLANGVARGSPGAVSLLETLLANEDHFVARGCGSPRRLFKELEQ